MTEVKFKLKLNRKTVGHMRIAPWGTAPMQIAYHSANENLWEPACSFVFDSIHPLVCLDRKGQEVYEDDMVLEDSLRWRMQWDKSDLGWCLRDVAGEKPPQIPDPQTIELILEATP